MSTSHAMGAKTKHLLMNRLTELVREHLHAGPSELEATWDYFQKHGPADLYALKRQLEEEDRKLTVLQRDAVDVSVEQYTIEIDEYIYHANFVFEYTIDVPTILTQQRDVIGGAKLEDTEGWDWLQRAVKQQGRHLNVKRRLHVVNEVLTRKAMGERDTHTGEH